MTSNFFFSTAGGADAAAAAGGGTEAAAEQDDDGALEAAEAKFCVEPCAAVAVADVEGGGAEFE